jgi:hypothetical protein
MPDQRQLVIRHLAPAARLLRRLRTVWRRVGHRSWWRRLGLVTRRPRRTEADGGQGLGLQKDLGCLGRVKHSPGSATCADQNDPPRHEFDRPLSATRPSIRLMRRDLTGVPCSPCLISMPSVRRMSPMLALMSSSARSTANREVTTIAWSLHAGRCGMRSAADSGSPVAPIGVWARDQSLPSATHADTAHALHRTWRGCNNL